MRRSRRTSRNVSQTAPLDPPALWSWQTEALKAWQNNGQKGIVTAPTGSGKTRLALAAIAKFWSPESRVLIVVPTIALQQQWARELVSMFRLREEQVGLVGGSNDRLHHNHTFIVSVINSARSSAQALIAGWRAESRRTMLVVDECHWAASTSNTSIFHEPADSTLGISATPDRGDDGLARVLIPALGEVVFTYLLKDGLDDGLLAPLLCINLYFDLQRPEREQLEPIQASIDELESILFAGDGKAPPQTALLREQRLIELARASGAEARLRDLHRRRSEILGTATARRLLLDEICQAPLLQEERCLLFHERIAEAEQTTKELKIAGVSVAVDSSLDSPEIRTRELRAFKSGRATALVAVRTLDEGIDVPEAKLAIITAGSSSIRQRIQRIGRVVRKTGQTATVISVLARGTNEEFGVGQGDSSVVGADRVVHHRWPECSVEQVLSQPRPSSYSPILDT